MFSRTDKPNMAAGVMVLLLSLSALVCGVPQNASQNIPYVVKVISVYVCSGVIIHPRWILTAAQCFGSSKSAQIHWNNLVVDSTKVVIHPDYISALEPGTVILGNNDLALIQIKENISFLRCASKIELDGSEWPQDYMKYNRPCMAFGTSRHRATSANENYVHGRLFKAEHGDQACECLPQNLKPQLVCMKEADETFCAEDLGGPLICDNKLVAILHTLYDLRNCKKHSTKVAPACDKRTTISVCTYICPYLTWIKYYVPTIPDRPPSCRSSPIITSSALVVLFYFVFIVITHS